jgi:hypothetical protein
VGCCCCWCGLEHFLCICSFWLALIPAGSSKHQVLDGWLMHRGGVGCWDQSLLGRSASSQAVTACAQGQRRSEGVLCMVGGLFPNSGHTHQPGSISTESAELHLRSKGPAVAAMDTQQGPQDSRASATLLLLLLCQHRWAAQCNS